MKLYPLIDPLTNKLTPSARKLLAEIIQAHELSYFLKSLQIGSPVPDIDVPDLGPYTFGSPFSNGLAYPNPEDPDRPWGPIGPIVKHLFGELLIHTLKNLKVEKNDTSVLAAMKREKIMEGALKELSGSLRNSADKMQGSLRKNGLASIA